MRRPSTNSLSVTGCTVYHAGVCTCVEGLLPGRVWVSSAWRYPRHGEDSRPRVRGVWCRRLLVGREVTLTVVLGHARAHTAGVLRDYILFQLCSAPHAGVKRRRPPHPSPL